VATVYQFDEAEANLGKLLDEVEAGGEVMIARGEGRVVKLVAEPAAVRPRGKRVPGTLKGKIAFDDRFFDPLPEDELRRWEGRDD
jgi:antitoxin (DNA-binding transcriptional repressor) of toxin-antitoxin stability system